VLATAAAALVVPFFLLDMRRAAHGHTFLVGSGRFFLPAFPAVAVLFLLGVEHLLRRSRGAYRAAALFVVGVAFVNYVHVYWVWGLERHYGAHGTLLDVLYRATWDKPYWVTKTFLAAVGAAAITAFVAALAVTVFGARRERSAPAHESAFGPPGSGRPRRHPDVLRAAGGR
jgi:hypothetical protein